MSSLEESGIAGARPTTPFLEAGEWAALKRICAG
jgi:hypothetical protein